MEKSFYSLGETSQILNISRSLLYKMVESKTIKHIRIGRKILFSKADLNNFIETNTIDIIDWVERGRELLGNR